MALVFLAGFAGSCLVGFAAYGSDILNPEKAAFQFVVSGAICSALCAALVIHSPKAVWLVALAAVGAFIGATQPSTGARLLRDLVYIPTLVASCWLAWRASARLGFARYGRVLAWGVVFALCHFAMFGILTMLSGSPFNAEIAIAAARIGGLVGVGVGLGVLVAWRRESASVRAAN